MFAYADPPYPGLAARYYGEEESYAGEVDHGLLIRSLVAAQTGDMSGVERYHETMWEGLEGVTLKGWALSTSARALKDLLPICPDEHRVCAWVKPIAPAPNTYGLHNTWEPLIVVGGRRRRPGVRDWLSAQPARLGGSDLVGRKPLAFCAFVFEVLGMQPGDVLLDLFPGTGAVTRAWRELGGEPSRPGAGDASPGAATTLGASSAPRGDA